MVTDRLPSYKSAMRELGSAGRQKTARWLKNRAENSHQRKRSVNPPLSRFPVSPFV
ncbi:MAG: IS6 family transposase, partial [Hyphomonas sp.]|nr:IS6 family transposase [Hyphomonas sp.]